MITLESVKRNGKRKEWLNNQIGQNIWKWAQLASSASSRNEPNRHLKRKRKSEKQWEKAWRELQGADIENKKS